MLVGGGGGEGIYLAGSVLLVIFIQEVQIAPYSLATDLVQKTAKGYWFTSHKLHEALQEIESSI